MNALSELLCTQYRGGMLHIPFNTLSGNSWISWSRIILTPLQLLVSTASSLWISSSLRQFGPLPHRLFALAWMLLGSRFSSCFSTVLCYIHAPPGVSQDLPWSFLNLLCCEALGKITAKPWWLPYAWSHPHGSHFPCPCPHSGHFLPPITGVGQLCFLISNWKSLCWVIYISSF